MIYQSRASRGYGRTHHQPDGIDRTLPEEVATVIANEVWQSSRYSNAQIASFLTMTSILYLYYIYALSRRQTTWNNKF